MTNERLWQKKLGSEKRTIKKDYKDKKTGFKKELV